MPLCRNEPAIRWTRSVRVPLSSPKISPLSSQTTTSVHEKYATEQDDYAFNRTHVVVALAKQFPGETLVSRSQTKRVMARLDRFKEVVLSFEGIESIGPAFADEIFRVFRIRNEHPDIHIAAVNTNTLVQRMIRRAETSIAGEEQKSGSAAAERVPSEKPAEGQ